MQKSKGEFLKILYILINYIQTTLIKRYTEKKSLKALKTSMYLVVLSFVLFSSLSLSVDSDPVPCLLSLKNFVNLFYYFMLMRLVLLVYLNNEDDFMNLVCLAQDRLEWKSLFSLRHIRQRSLIKRK